MVLVGVSILSPLNEISPYCLVFLFWFLIFLLMRIALLLDGRSVPGAGSYVIQVSYDKGFNRLLAGWDPKTINDGIDTTVIGLESGYGYYYRVRSRPISTNYESAWSEIHCVNTLCLGFLLLLMLLRLMAIASLQIGQVMA